MRIYLDHNATTPLRPEVGEALAHAQSELFGNPSSTHAEGTRARHALEQARESVGRALGLPAEGATGRIVFTAGATESNNSIVRSEAFSGRTGQVVSTGVEHPSVMEPLADLAARGRKVTLLEVGADGLLDPDRLRAALGEKTDLVSLLWANNETGVLQPVAELSEIVREHGAWLHVDATQVLGKHPLHLGAIQPDSLALSAHKLNGPKGIGCLYVRDFQALEPWLRGGGQERGLRGGTENLAGIVGFGVACELAEKEVVSRMESYAMLRDRLWDGIASGVGDVKRNGSPEHVLCNTLNVEFEGTAGEVLLQALDLEGVAVSAGAACHSGSIQASHVLLGMGRTKEQARSSLRMSVGYGVDTQQIDRAIALLCELVPRAREAASS